MRKVLVFGSFDILHLGHLYFLKQAKKYGDYLMVVVARDNTIKRLKKHSPSKDEEERLREVKKCEFVDKAVLGYEKNPYRIVGELNPDVICLGYDQVFFTKNLKSKLRKIGLEPEIYRLQPYKPPIFHSSILRNKFEDNGRKRNSSEGC